MDHCFDQASFVFKKPLIMAILNVTADSFSDGGLYLKTEDALRQAENLIEAGADMIDLGGESTRPGAEKISLDEELARVIPTLTQLRQVSDIPISIDTYKPAVMKAVVECGASMINDVKALREPGALEVAAGLQVPICLMHMQREPKNMQDSPYYRSDVIDEINSFFEARIQACSQAGIKRHLLILDPGFGYGKTVEHNLRIVKHFSQFRRHDLPLLLGFSRKSTLGKVLNAGVHERLIGGVALSVYTALQGISIIRTHDVTETKAALDMLSAVMENNGKQGVCNEST